MQYKSKHLGSTFTGVTACDYCFGHSWVGSKVATPFRYETTKQYFKNRAQEDLSFFFFPAENVVHLLTTDIKCAQI